MSKEKFIETYKKCSKIKKLKKNLKCNLCNLLIENADEVTFFSNERQMIKFFIYQWIMILKELKEESKIHLN